MQNADWKFISQLFDCSEVENFQILLTVKIQTGPIIDPPQKCADVPKKNHCMLTMKENSPGIALLPPTIKGTFSLSATTMRRIDVKAKNEIK